MGQYYLYCMVLTNLLSLFIYNVFGKWFFPRTLAVINLVALEIGIFFSRKRKYEHWLKIHIGCFILSYYLLFGGGINKALLRIEPLQTYYYNGHQIEGLTHFVAILVFTALIRYFLFFKNLKSS